jgi:hypothetical protein
VTQKPVSPGRTRYKPLTPLRGECRCFGFTCSDFAGVLLIFAHWAMGAAQAPGIPCALSFRGRTFCNNSGAVGVAGMLCVVYVIARSRATKQSGTIAMERFWIASLRSQ